jgi:hypothetical protein
MNKLANKLFIILLFVFINHCTFLGFQTVKLPKNVKEKYTLMVYMVGSDLEAGTSEWSGGAATTDMKEMMSVGSTPNLNIVVTTGGALEWKQKDIDPEKIQRWKIEKKGKTRLEDAQEAYMSVPITLKNFITYSIKNFPADRYSLILWNHGMGAIDGYGSDQLSGRAMRLDNIRYALEMAYQETGVKFDIIGFDACLMATIETADVLSPFANFMVASEEIEPGHGWDYSAITKEIAENPVVSPQKLGRTIAESYQRQARFNFTSKDITLSVIDLSKVKPVIEHLEAFVEKAGKDIKDPVRFQEIAGARSKSEDYGNAPGFSFDMTDLMDLAINLRNIYPPEANNVVDSIRRAVIFKIRGKGKPASNGLSIYFPGKSRDTFQSNASMYPTINFSSKYTRFVQLYTNQLLADKTPIRFLPSTIVEDDGTKVAPAKGRKYTVKISKDDVSNIREMYAMLTVAGGQKNPHIKFFLGADNDVSIEDNTISYTMKDSSLTINGSFVSLFLLSISKGEDGNIFKTYAVPIRLNGKKCDLLVLYDVSKKEYEVIGVRRPPDPKTRVIPKDLITLQKGDIIIPVWRFHDPVKNEKGTVPGKQFIVSGSELDFKYSKLPDGKYFISFYAIDLAGNESFSEYKDL